MAREMKWHESRAKESREAKAPENFAESRKERRILLLWNCHVVML